MFTLRIATIQVFFLLLFIGTQSGFASKDPILTNSTEIESAVHTDLEQWISSDSYLKFKEHHFPEIKGSLTVAIGVSGNGKIETIFNQDNSTNSIAFFNAFSDLLKKHTFAFKMKKGERIKIIHTFKIQ
ncbi:MAG: hypothetical protein IPP51_04380 [Bacteroidetes bacterium]|nr:hypothetical protein [Bacteroidota bacterium]